EVCLQLDDRIPLLTRETLDSADEQLLQTLRQVRPTEELGWLPVFVTAFTDMDLPKISGEFGLLVPACRNVLVRRDDFSPWLQRPGRLTFDRCAGRATFLRSHLFVEAKAEQ